MEIPLLLMMLIALALLLGDARARRPAFAAPPIREAPASLEPADGLVSLPSAVRTYSEKASRAEMNFAGLYLNLVGIALLTLGTLSYLHVSGISERVFSGGWLQCSLGAGLGALLSWAGDRFHQRGLRNYSQPLLAAGASILLLTLAAAHFYFHLLPSAGLAVGIFTLVGWSSLAVIRYESWLIGAGMLTAVFVGPLAMTFSFEEIGAVLGYLLAVNLAITLVAYRQKWDGFLIASFLGTYGLYFHQFGMSHHAMTLIFLAFTYTLFLISGTLFHFLRRTASDFNLGLSLVNPLAFAAVSYKVLLFLPNTLALAIYTAIAIIHLVLARIAAGLRGQGDAYVQMGQSNLALGILFSTASISFLTYCNVLDDSYFGLVTFLWLAQAFALLKLAGRLSSGFSSIARRGSYIALALATTQLLYVIPTMEEPVWIEFSAIFALLGYFSVHEKSTTSREERLFSNLVVVAAVSCGHQAIVSGFLTTLVSISALAPLMLVAYRRFPTTLAPYRFASSALAAAITAVAVSSHWSHGPESLTLILLAALVGVLTPICLPVPELQKESPLGAVLAALLLLRGCVVLARWQPAWALALAAAIIFATYLLSQRVSRLEPAAFGFAVLVTAAGFLIPANEGGDLIALAVLIGLFLEGCRREIQRGRIDSAFGAAALASAIGLKTAFVADSGAGSTLLWCLLAVGLLRLGGRKQERILETGRLVFFLAFLKAITLDANFIYGAQGWEVAAMRAPSLAQLSLVIAVIACFAWASRISRHVVAWRNYFSLFGLLVFAFQTTFVLYNFFGILDTFQILLSGFWACASLLFIAYGIHCENRLFRLFGLVVQVSCLVKIYAVDIWVLSAYDQTTTTLILGALLMLVSFLYQSNRSRLLDSPLCLA